MPSFSDLPMASFSNLPMASFSDFPMASFSDFPRASFIARAIFRFSSGKPATLLSVGQPFSQCSVRLPVEKSFCVESMLPFHSATSSTSSELMTYMLSEGYSPEHLASMEKTIELFESWMSKHSKTYRSIEEKLHRFETFVDNLKYIDETNKKVSSYRLGLNNFADLKHEEFNSKYCGGLRLEK